MSLKRKKSKKVKGPIKYAYRDSSGAKRILSIEQAHVIAEEKKAKDAIVAREAFVTVTELEVKEEKGSKERLHFKKVAANHLRRAKRLERPGYKVGKACLGIGMRKVTSKHEKAEPASKAANKLIKKRNKARA